MTVTNKIAVKWPNFGHVVQRFPVAVLAMAIFSLIWIFTPDDKLRETIIRTLIGLVVAAYLCVIITLAREVTHKSKLYFLQILIVGLMTALFYFSESLRINMAMAVGAVLLVLGNAVGWRRPRNDLHIWDFTHKLWTGAIMATVGSVIFLLGLLAIMEALKTLLGIDVESLVVEFLMPIGFGFLAPLYWMSTLPPVDEPYEELYENPGFVSKAIGFLGTWLLAPLSMIYAAIILIYGVKILFAMNLPKGEIAELTTPFLLIGTITWLVLEPPFIQKNALARWFRWLWFPVSIPVALLLAVAVFVRVQAYGVTEERYALILVVIWSLGLGLWFIFRKETQRDIRIVPGLGAILLLMGTFSALPVSLKSQTNRAQEIVADLNLLDANNKIRPIETPTEDQTDQLRQLKTQILYLSRHKAKRSIKSVFPNAPDKDVRQTIFEELNIKDLSIYKKSNHRNNYFADDSQTIDVEGFSVVKGLYSIGNLSNIKTSRALTGKDEAVNIVFERGELHVTHADGHAVTLQVESAIRALAPYKQKPFIVDIGNRTRVQIKTMTLRSNADTGEQDIMRLTFYVLLRN
ncbi:MAG: DUF4153 domain-containing protein [Maricaulaceae bacterium]